MESKVSSPESPASPPEGASTPSSGQPEAGGGRRNPRRRAQRARVEEPLVIIGGRTLLGVLAILPALLPYTVFKTLKSPEPAKTDLRQWHAGGRTRLRLTIVAVDSQRLACASNDTYSGLRCEFKQDGTLFPPPADAPIDDNKRSVIQPYRTYPDNQLVLVAGVWATPKIATRLHSEPFVGLPDNKQARFVADCDVEFVADVQNPKLRWNPTSGWMTDTKAVVGRAQDCFVGNTD